MLLKYYTWSILLCYDRGRFGYWFYANYSNNSLIFFLYGPAMDWQQQYALHLSVWPKFQQKGQDFWTHFLLKFFNLPVHDGLFQSLCHVISFTLLVINVKVIGPFFFVSAHICLVVVTVFSLVYLLNFYLLELIYIVTKL